MLPKIDVPVYEIKLPSTGEFIKFRPFTVKEEKLFLMAYESDDAKYSVDTIIQVLNNCIISDIDIKDLPTFDIEYLFLNIRGKSVGETAEVLITCPDDGQTQVPVTINLDDIKVEVNDEHSRDIQLDDNLSVRMKYPSIQEFIKNNFIRNDQISVDDTFGIITSCVEQIYNEEESWSASDCTKKELADFLESLSSKQFKKIEKFFETMPKLSHTINVKNPNTGLENKIVLEGLTSFFA